MVKSQCAGFGALVCRVQGFAGFLLWASLGFPLLF